MNFQRIREIASMWLHSAVVQRFLSGSLWRLLARGMWIFSALIVGTRVARYLGPHDFGVLTYSVAYVGMWAVLANLGVDSLVSKNFVLYPERRNRIMGNYFLFKVLTTLIMLTAIGFSLCFFQDSQKMLFCLIVASGYLVYPMSVVGVVFPALVKNQYQAFAELITCLLYSAARVWAVWSGQQLMVFIFFETMLTGGTSLAFWGFYCWKCGNPFQWTWKIKEAVSLIVPAIPLTLTAVISSVYARVDMLMIEHFLGVSLVGFYSIATHFVENIDIAFGILNSIFSVVVIQAYKTSQKEYGKQYHRFIFMMFYLVLPPLLVVLCVIRPLILFLYGEDFLPSVSIFYYFSTTLFASSLMRCFYVHALNENRLKGIAAVYFAGFLINVPLNLLLISRMGACGAALSSGLSMSLGMILVLSCTKKGRQDLLFILFSLTHLPSLKLNRQDSTDGPGGTNGSFVPSEKDIP